MCGMRARTDGEGKGCEPIGRRKANPERGSHLAGSLGSAEGLEGSAGGKEGGKEGWVCVEKLCAVMGCVK